MHSQREFFYAVLSQEGLPCLAWSNGPGQGFSHKVFDTLQEFCEYTSNIDFTEHNYYFCISTLADKSIKVGGKDRIRVQQNMLRSRCLVLDIDFKDGIYANIDEALAATNALAESFKLPTPIAVSSGNGMHVYWPFAEGIPSKDWVALTKKFKAAASLFHPGLFADSSRVSDSAGILRIPDSFNLKYDPIRPVEIIQWNSDIVDVGALRTKLGVLTKVTPEKDKVSLSLQVDEAPPAELSSVAKNCNWLRTYIKERADATEPEWYAVLGLAPYLEHTTNSGVLRGEQIAQALSKGHPLYDPSTTTAKYEQARQSQTGPTTCERLRGIEASRCEGCPFATTVKTPIQTGRLAKPATQIEEVETRVIDEAGNVSVETVTIPLYPSPYFRGEDGGVFVRRKEKTEDGWADVIERVYDYDLYPVKRYRTESLENEIMEVHLWLPYDGLRVFKLPTSLLAEQKKLAIYLAEKGVIAENGKAGAVARYLVDFIRYLQSIGAAEVEFSRFGWRDIKSANPKFVVGNGYIDKNGELQPASYAYFLKDAAKSAATAGTLEEWKKGFSVYEGIPDSEAFILAGLMGFAAPLIALTPYKGVLYNMVGHSAAGKSTALQVMTSVWGQPKESHVDTRDNEIPIYNFIGYLNALPVAMDELTHMEGDKLARFALSFTSGRGKMRANRDGTNKINETEWETIVVGTSNTSLYDKLASQRKGYSAEAMRIFEVNLGPSHPEYKPRVTECIRILENNYGHAGRVFMEYVIKNTAAIEPVIMKAIESITERGQLRNEERFWAAMFACVLVGGSIAKKLGLHNYNVQKIVDTFCNMSTDVREAVRTSQSDPISVLSDFFNNNLDSMIKFTEDGKPYLGADGHALSSLRTVKMRLELGPNKQPKLMWISIGALRDYCGAKKIDPSWLSRELRELGIIRKGSYNQRLTAGSSISGGTSIKCYVVEMTDEKLYEITADLKEEIDTQPPRIQEPDYDEET